ncbi:uncharacterized protein UDID_18882 [Ustilago sp. UG-2017a]|nr:uncharacterized protein UDID_18882 [Ustilago sp. UG-2017a]
MRQASIRVSGQDKQGLSTPPEVEIDVLPDKQAPQFSRDGSSTTVWSILAQKRLRDSPRRRQSYGGHLLDVVGKTLARHDQNKFVPTPVRFELTPSKRISFPQRLLVALFNKVAGIRVNHSTKASCLAFEAKREFYNSLHIVSTLKLIFNAKQLIPRRSSDVATEIGPVKLQLAYTDEELSLIGMSSCPFVFDHGPWHDNTIDSGFRSVLFVSLNFSMFQMDAHALSFYAARARRNSYDQN